MDNLKSNLKCILNINITEPFIAIFYKVFGIRLCYSDELTDIYTNKFN